MRGSGLLAAALVLLAGLALAGCRPDAPPAVQAGAAAPLKIYISGPGIYELSAADLAPYGQDAAPADLRLSLRGKPQPLWVSGEGDDLKVRFYGESSASRYTQENVYWLQSGGSEASSMVVAPKGQEPPAADPLNQAEATLRLEENLLYSPQVDAEDHFFMAKMAAPSDSRYEFTLAETAPGPAVLRVAAWGSTEAPVEMDHLLQVSINGQPVAETGWDGKGRHTLEAEIPPGVLADGRNEILLTAPGAPDVLVDILFLDWIEIIYPRKLTAAGDRLDFPGAEVPLLLSGFNAPVTVFDVTDPEAVQVVSQGKPGSQGYLFQGREGHRYSAVGPEGYQAPGRLEPAVLVPDLRALSEAEYIAVGPADLLEPLKPLLDWRTSQGLTTVAVPIEAVYDQFGYGLPEPQALQAFMAYAGDSWQAPPAYLLLVGDATYDPAGYITPPEANRLPSFLIQTVYGGETASDVDFGQLDDDPWPEIATGRLPARNPAQVAVFVEKALAYERTLPEQEAWQQRVLAVADGREARFSTDAQNFLQRFGEAYETHLLAPEAGDPDASQELRARLREGTLLVAYFGHGSLTQWGRDAIFSTDEISGLGNGERLPVVVNMTCLTGLFTHPEVDSLAETLLWEKGGGAVAVLAPTSLTLPSDQSFLSNALVAALLADPQATLGEVSLEARRSIQVDTAGGRDVMQTFLLFGDPALRMAR